MYTFIFCIHVGMYTFIYAYMYICIFVLYICIILYMYMFIYVYVCILVYMYICIYVYMYTCIHVYMYIWIYACIYVYMYVCLYVCMYISIYVCMYISIYVYMFIYVYIYMYIYIYMLPPPPPLQNLPFIRILKRILLENINPTLAFNSRPPRPLGGSHKWEPPNSGLRNSYSVDYKNLREIYLFGSARGSGLRWRLCTYVYTSLLRYSAACVFALVAVLVSRL